MAKTIGGKRYSWTQPTCETCFAGLSPNVVPTRIKEEYRDMEQCCMCGASTQSGLYTRVDPAEVPHPTPEEPE